MGMDSQPDSGIVNRFVSGIKEKTVKFAESKLQKSIQEVPEEAILGFVASAVRLGAQRLEVRIQGTDLVLAHDARKISEAVAGQLHRGVEGLPELSKAFRLHLGHALFGHPRVPRPPQTPKPQRCRRRPLSTPAQLRDLLRARAPLMMPP